MTPHLLKRRLMLWVLGRALPEVPLLAPFVRVGLLGLTASLAGGLLFTLGCVSALAAFYLYLTAQGIEPVWAFLIVSGTTFILAAAVFFGAQRIFKRRLEMLNSAAQAPDPLALDDTLLEIPVMVINSFLEGVLGHKPQPRTRP